MSIASFPFTLARLDGSFIASVISAISCNLTCDPVGVVITTRFLISLTSVNLPERRTAVWVSGFRMLPVGKSRLEALMTPCIWAGVTPRARIRVASRFTCISLCNPPIRIPFETPLIPESRGRIRFSIRSKNCVASRVDVADKIIIALSSTVTLDITGDRTDTGSCDLFASI